MGDENHRLAFFEFLELFFQPAHILGRPMPVAHFHEGAFVDANEPVACVIEHKPISRPDAREICRAGFRPLGVVVSRDDVIGDFELREDLVCQTELFHGAVFRDIAGDDHEIDPIKPVDIAHGCAEVIGCGGGADVGIGEPGKSEWGIGRAGCNGGKRAEQHKQACPEHRQGRAAQKANFV
ncbi:hypothetical protein SDC9_162909 [bioreactor metagenome]|uniref:Uncharacterized protein n=1 Tax=bioreactor metagenome TaxID=1076179 RepID=A0A645FMD1_9ZZZZ